MAGAPLAAPYAAAAAWARASVQHGIRRAHDDDGSGLLEWLGEEMDVSEATALAAVLDAHLYLLRNCRLALARRLLVDVSRGAETSTSAARRVAQIVATEGKLEAELHYVLLNGDGVGEGEGLAPGVSAASVAAAAGGSGTPIRVTEASHGHRVDELVAEAGVLCDAPTLEALASSDDAGFAQAAVRSSSGDDTCIVDAATGQCAHGETGDRDAEATTSSLRSPVLAGGSASTAAGDVVSPRVHLGTADILGEDLVTAIAHAVHAGYRAIDTAEMYDNEAEVGRGVRNAAASGGVARRDLFVTTKLTAGHFSEDGEAAKAEVYEQLTRLDTSYVDLYLLHEPGGDEAARHGAWRALEELVHGNAIRSIGVSNFDCSQLRALRDTARSGATVGPSAVQNKFDPYHQGGWVDGLPWGGRMAPTPLPPRARAYNEGAPAADVVNSDAACLGDMTYYAYSTVSGWPFLLRPVHDPHVVAVAHSVGRSPGQVLLRWALQLGASVIPRSRSAARIVQNAQLFDFDLTPDMMRRLSGLAWFCGHSVQPPPSDDVYAVQASADAAAKWVVQNG